MLGTSKIRDIVAPRDTDLWKRAMVDERSDDSLGHDKVVPFFGPRILRHDQIGDKSAVYNSYSGEAAGWSKNFESDLTFGEYRDSKAPEPENVIQYASKLYVPNGEPRYPFYIDIDTPLGTGIEGLNDEVAERLMIELGVPVYLKGPEFSAKHDKSMASLIATTLAAANISQSFTAEMSMELSERVVFDESLPQQAVVYGKSRGGMIGGRKHTYSQERGLDIIHYRLIDPCVADRALASISDTLRYISWPVTDFARSTPSFARFALEGKLRKRAKTVNTNRHAALGMVAGTIPSLLSGEEMGSRIPLDRGISFVHMAGNPIADTPQYLDQFAGHTNFDNHERRDAHIGGIILPRNIGRTVRHLRDFGNELEAAGFDRSSIDYIKVHDNPKKKLAVVHSVAA